MSGNQQFQLLKKIKITGKIRLITGLCIGGTDTGIEIGGLDKTIVRNPITDKPYIPGSSLKGKLRSMLEIYYGHIIKTTKKGHVTYVGSDNIEYITTRLFGNSRGDEFQRPSRLIVRDCDIIEESFRGKELNLPYAEVKTEVVIDRITSQAMPRTIERVPAGAEFNLEMILNIYNDPYIQNKQIEDSEDEYINALKLAMKLLENDYLGGNGSRGYGQIKFVNVTFKEVDLTEEFLNV